MAVVVRLAGQGQRERTFADADDFGLDDVGCLIVTKGDGKDEVTIAAFAPGVWAWAEVS